MVKTNALFDIFGGERVSIITSVQISTEISLNGEMALEKRPIIFHGFLIDVDRQFAYLGETPREATTAVALNQILSIDIFDEMTDTSDKLHDLLQSIPIDTDPEKAN